MMEMKKSITLKKTISKTKKGRTSKAKTNKNRTKSEKKIIHEILSQRSIKNRKVIGEGSYGCVHKPSLKCDKKHGRVNYKNKISKILSTEEAENEMKEYNIIANIDKENGFFLGKPVMCSVRQSENNLNAISKCEQGYELLKNINNESLLIMDYGGENLDILSQEFNKMKKTKENKDIVKKFLGKAHRLFLGIQFLYKNNIIHHDMKPQNILYNKQNNHINFIDFGFTTFKQDVKDSSLKSDNWLSKYHWSYPLEINYINYNKYMDFAKLNQSEKKEVFDTIVNNLKNGENDKCSLAMSILFSYIIPEHVSETAKNKMIDLYLNDYHIMLQENITKDGYENFINKSLETLDLYGLGIAFFLLVNSCRHLFKKSFIKELTSLCYYMTTPNLTKRYNIQTALNKYEEILEKHNIPIYVDPINNKT